MAHRTLKRVSLDFDWPPGVEWEGYHNPYEPLDCSSCDATGYNEATRRIASEGFEVLTQDEIDALVSNRRLIGTVTGDPLENSSAHVVNVLHQAGLIKMGESVPFILIKARAERLGVYGNCSNCNGWPQVFEDEEEKRLFGEWEEYEPPIGEGWQLWKTVCTLSPVFASAEELAAWAAENDFYDLSKEEWLELFQKGKEAVEASCIQDAMPK